MQVFYYVFPYPQDASPRSIEETGPSNFDKWQTTKSMIEEHSFFLSYIYINGHHLQSSLHIHGLISWVGSTFNPLKLDPILHMKLTFISRVLNYMYGVNQV